MKFIGSLIRRFVEGVKGGAGFRMAWFEPEPTGPPEEVLTRFCKMVREGKIKAWVFILGVQCLTPDRDGSIRTKESVTFLSPYGLTAPELRFIGARLVSRAEEMERRQDPRSLNL